LSPETANPKFHAQSSTAAPAYSKAAVAKTVVYEPPAPPSFPVAISVSPVRVKDYAMHLMGDKEEKEMEDFIPVASDKPSDLDLEEFLPVNNLEYNIFS
jgi:predicted RecB family nuclease